MDKFVKRVLKIKKNARNALVVGSKFTSIFSLAPYLTTVFIINDGDRSIRGKNIIYKEDFSNLNTYSDIDFLFIDYDQYGNLPKLQPVLQKHKPVIFVDGETVWPTAEYNFLKNYGYNTMDLYKGMQLWIPKI